MKGFFISLFAAFLAVAATAQIFKGEGGSFPIRYQLGSYDHLGYMRLHEPLATVCCYLDKDGHCAKHTFKIYIYQMGERLDVKDSGTITFHFADGSSENATFETVNRRSDVWQSGVRYVAEVESDIDLANLKGKMLLKTVIDGYASPMEFFTPAKRAKKLAKTIAKSEKLALRNALAAKANGEAYKKALFVPFQVQHYLDSIYPGIEKCEVEKIDTIEVPARTLLSLDFAMQLDLMEMTKRIKNFKPNELEEYGARLLEEAERCDSLIENYDRCLARIDSISKRNKKCDIEDRQNYQRVKVNFTGKSAGSTEVLTRMGEEKPSSVAMSFGEKLKNCKDRRDEFAKIAAKLKLDVEEILERERAATRF